MQTWNVFSFSNTRGHLLNGEQQSARAPSYSVLLAGKTWHAPLRAPCNDVGPVQVFVLRCFRWRSDNNKSQDSPGKNMTWTIAMECCHWLHFLFCVMALSSFKFLCVFFTNKTSWRDKDAPRVMFSTRGNHDNAWKRHEQAQIQAFAWKTTQWTCRSVMFRRVVTFWNSEVS